jgi:hypothetical protein
MGWYVSYWCNEIGVTDPMAQNVAAGVVAATLLMASIAAILAFLLWIITIALARAPDSP